MGSVVEKGREGSLPQKPLSIRMSDVMSIADIEFWMDRDVKALREQATFA